MSNDIFATDEECKERRNLLIDAGVITPQKGTVKRRFSEDFIPAEKEKRIISEATAVEEGVYRKHRVTNERNYQRRVANYFYMLQNVLRDRKRLNLVFEKSE